LVGLPGQADRRAAKQREMKSSRFTIQCFSDAPDRKDSTPPIETAALRVFDPAYARFGSFTSFPPSRRVRFVPRADVRTMPAFMSRRFTGTSRGANAGCLYGLNTQHDPWRASRLAWCPVATTMASSVRCSRSISRSSSTICCSRSACRLVRLGGQNSTGAKTRLGGITKRGNRYLRRLLINGASANLLRSKVISVAVRQDGRGPADARPEACQRSDHLGQVGS
jgi:hypothetical protein